MAAHTHIHVAHICTGAHSPLPSLINTLPVSLGKHICFGFRKNGKYIQLNFEFWIDAIIGDNFLCKIIQHLILFSNLINCTRNQTRNIFPASKSVREGITKCWCCLNCREGNFTCKKKEKKRIYIYIYKWCKKLAFSNTPHRWTDTRWRCGSSRRKA